MNVTMTLTASQPGRPFNTPEVREFEVVVEGAKGLERDTLRHAAEALIALRLSGEPDELTLSDSGMARLVHLEEWATTTDDSDPVQVHGDLRAFYERMHDVLRLAPSEQFASEGDMPLLVEVANRTEQKLADLRVERDEARAQYASVVDAQAAEGA